MRGGKKEIILFTLNYFLGEILRLAKDPEVQILVIHLFSCIYDLSRIIFSIFVHLLKFEKERFMEG